MKIKSYNHDGSKFILINEESPLVELDKGEIWLQNEEEGGVFKSDDVANVIYNALEKFFKENH